MDSHPALEAGVPIPEDALAHSPRSPEKHLSFQSSLPACASLSEIYNARLGRSRMIPSFETALASKLIELEDATSKRLGTSIQSQAEIASQSGEIKLEAKSLFAEVVHNLTPQLLSIIEEMKRLGIQNDLELSPQLKILKYALKANQWGERPAKDYPLVIGEGKTDLNNPNHRIIVEGNKVKVTTLTGLTDQSIDSISLTRQLQKLLDTLGEMKIDESFPEIPQDIKDFVIDQSVSRSMLEAKHLLRPDFADSFAGAHHVKDLNPQQASNKIELWQTQNGREFIVKGGPLHTLQAEVLENRVMKLMGLPVPDTMIQGDPPKLVVGFLYGYQDPPEKFSLPEYYHANRLLQGGLITDLWLNQYNRRAHNVMLKDGKVAFIDHGGAAFCRASGGFKGFEGRINTETVFDIVRAIPDDNWNGDEPVNEAYAQVLTVEGGETGRIIIKDPNSLRSQLRRLSRVSDEQIAELVEEAGYVDGEMSVDQMRWWKVDPDNPKGIQATLASLRKKDPAQLSKRELQYLRWTEGAFKTLDLAIAAGGMRSYMIQTLIERRNNLLNLLGPLTDQELQKRAEAEKVLTQEVNERYAAAVSLVTAHNESGNYNYLAMIEIVLKSLQDPKSLPSEGYATPAVSEVVARLRQATPLKGLERISPVDFIRLQKECLQRLLEIDPPLNPGSLEAVAKIASLAETVIWTVGDMDDQDHTLPPGLISTERLLGSGYQLRKLEHGQITERIKALASTKGRKARVFISASSNKVKEMQRLIDQAFAAGHDQILIFDDSVTNLELAKHFFASLPESVRPEFKLILINQGRKRQDTPQLLTDIAKGGEYHVITSSSSKTADAILLAPQIVEQLINSGKNPFVLMDFDGVIGDNTAQREQQVGAIARVLKPLMTA